MAWKKEGRRPWCGGGARGGGGATSLVREGGRGRGGQLATGLIGPKVEENSFSNKN
jgi:hypothetical protein